MDADTLKDKDLIYAFATGSSLVHQPAMCVLSCEGANQAFPP
jgi:hypothetical protein